VLVHNNWLYAATYYDTPVSFDRFLWRDREAALAAEPRARVWVIALSEAGGRALLELVKDYRPADEVSVHGAKALLFDPPPPE
jgi:predicted RecB family nuclease